LHRPDASLRSLFPATAPHQSNEIYNECIITSKASFVKGALTVYPLIHP